MKLEIETVADRRSTDAPFSWDTAPSLRLRPTARNRGLLRWLRAAEMAAWNDPDPTQTEAALEEQTKGPGRRLFRLMHTN